MAAPTGTREGAGNEESATRDSGASCFDSEAWQSETVDRWLHEDDARRPATNNSGSATTDGSSRVMEIRYPGFNYSFFRIVR